MLGNMAHIPGLRSPYDQVGGIVHFGRLLDKIRLHARGELPAEYSEFIGPYPGSFDYFCIGLLQVDYNALTRRTLEGGSDGEILAWAFENGRQPTSDEILIWNSFLSKRGWRDDARARVIFRLNEAGIPLDSGIETMFDFIDADEGRPLRKFD